VTSFDMGSEVSLRAYEGYFLGRPKVGEVHVRLLPDLQTMYLNILAGQVDVFPENTLTGDFVFDLQERWDGTGAGTSVIKAASTRFLAPQLRPNLQIEPANLDLRVRQALYHALDRDTLAEALNGGHREMAAWEILPSNDVNYPAVKDGLRQYTYDPERAKAILRDAGWTSGPDGSLRSTADGRRFRNAILGLPGGNTEREISAFADYWRRVGMDVELAITPPVQAANLEYRASFPGWQSTAQGVGDGILARLVGPAAGPETRWQGNPGGYDDPRGQALVDRYRASVSARDQLDAMKTISEFWAAELPLLVLYNGTHSVGHRTGVKALEDHNGGGNGSLWWGTYTRNAHLWDVE
jgi:peptide/nickel transport system substrate-binding protein